MSLIEKLEKELCSAKNVTTMEHVEYQDKFAAKSLLLDFKVAVESLCDDELAESSDYGLDEIGPTIH